jgi:hypothetical protein
VLYSVLHMQFWAESTTATRYAGMRKPAENHLSDFAEVQDRLGWWWWGLVQCGAWSPSCYRLNGSKSTVHNGGGGGT